MESITKITLHRRRQSRAVRCFQVAAFGATWLAVWTAAGLETKGAEQGDATGRQTAQGEAAEGGRVLFADDFADKLAEGWRWIREDRQAWRLADGALQIRTQPGNMWGGANNAKNLLAREIPESAAKTLALDVTVSNRPTERWEQLGITWYYDDAHMVKLVKELVDGKVSIVMGREEADRTRTIVILPLESASVQLRLQITGNQVTGLYRPDGKGAWKEAGKCDSPGKGKANVCLQTYNGSADAEHWARFSRFRIREVAPR
ncbi:MAG: hypothetical protein JXB62_17610 [Pirellulales bacterium]|nr:hypothetical protein [Pirellulales bacterium]